MREKLLSNSTWSNTTKSAGANRIALELVLLSCAGLGIQSCSGARKSRARMELGEMLNAVTNERIEFATRQASPSSSDRRVVITGPREVLELSASGDPQALRGLIELLHDPERAWGAEGSLAAMTRNEEEIVNDF